MALEPNVPIDAAEALIVVGALSWNAADRSLKRHQVNPVQVLTSDGITPVRSLDRGEFGLSSLAIRPEAGVVYGSSGVDFFKLDLRSAAFTSLPIADLNAVHEVTEIDGALWIANTGLDEVVVFDTATEEVTRRIPVRSIRNNRLAAEPDSTREPPQSSNSHHANQAARALDGRLYVVAHYVDGTQALDPGVHRPFAMQRTGGVMELETGRPVALSLSGPHSLQIVGPDEQWICDSLAGLLRVYDSGWRERAQISCAGWGRGVAISERRPLAYVGISTVRRRYQQLMAPPRHTENLIQAFDITGRRQVGETVIPHVEQVSNVYCVRREIAESLLRA